MIMAQRKSDNETKPPLRYSNYIYFYDSQTDQFNCTDANCVNDFI